MAEMIVLLLLVYLLGASLTWAAATRREHETAYKYNERPDTLVPVLGALIWPCYIILMVVSDDE